MATGGIEPDIDVWVCSHGSIESLSLPFLLLVLYISVKMLYRQHYIMNQQQPNNVVIPNGEKLDRF